MFGHRSRMIWLVNPYLRNESHCLIFFIFFALVWHLVAEMQLCLFHSEEWLSLSFSRGSSSDQLTAAASPPAETPLCSDHRHPQHRRLQHIWEVLKEGNQRLEMVMKVPRSCLLIHLLLFLLQPSSSCCAFPSCYSSLFQDYQRMLDLIRDIILATDLAHHLRIFKDLQKMADSMLGALGRLTDFLRI